MSLLALLLVIALIGLVTWAIVTLIPMPAPFPRIIIVVAVIVVILIVLNAFGVMDEIRGVRVPHI